MANELDIIEKLLAARYSCRAFKPDQVPRAHIERVLNAAQKTASWCNSQPWQVAIFSAIHHAAPGDVVLLAGKGHETYQEIKGVRHPFSDIEVARAALAEWQGAAR